MIENFKDNSGIMDNFINTELCNRAFTGTKDTFHPVTELFRVCAVYMSAFSNMELDGTWIVVLKVPKTHLKNSTTMPLSRNHDLVTQNNPQAKCHPVPLYSREGRHLYG